MFGRRLKEEKVLLRADQKKNKKKRFNEISVPKAAVFSVRGRGSDPKRAKTNRFDAHEDSRVVHARASVPEVDFHLVR